MATINAAGFAPSYAILGTCYIDRPKKSLVPATYFFVTYRDLDDLTTRLLAEFKNQDPLTPFQSNKPFSLCLPEQN